VVAFSAVLAVLALALAPTSASGTAKQKPSYALTAVLHGPMNVSDATGTRQYRYYISVRNTGRKTLHRVKACLSPRSAVVSPTNYNKSVGSAACWIVNNLKPAKTWRKNLKLVLDFGEMLPPPWINNSWITLKVQGLKPAQSARFTKAYAIHYKPSS
jgi:hypothetical protein